MCPVCVCPHRRDSLSHRDIWCRYPGNSTTSLALRRPPETGRVQNCSGRRKIIPFGFRSASLEGSSSWTMSHRNKIPRHRWIILLMLEILVPSISGELRWGIMSTFPLPMPVMHNAQIFPRFFTTNKKLGIAYLPLDEQIQALQENRTFFIQESLCFVLISSLQDKTQCIYILV